MSKIFSRFLSAEQVLFEGEGLYSVIRVTKKGGQINLYTGKGFLQSSVNSWDTPHGTIFDWYLSAPWFSGNFEGTLNSLLILGLGAGSLVLSYNQIYKVKSITGVEIDPLIIELSKKHFNLNEANLKTINGDALFFLEETTDTYNQIILDLFKEDVFEENCQSSSFFHKIRNHLTPEGVLLVNRVLSDPSNWKLERELKKVFNTVLTIRIYNNVFFISTNSQKSPKSSIEVQQLLLKATKSHPKLGFFRSLKLKDVRVL